MRSRPAPAWAIGVALVVLVAIASFATAWLVWDRAEERARVDDARAAEAAREALQSSVGRVLTTMRGADGLVAEDGTVDAASFRAFAQALASISGGGSLSLSAVVSRAERASFEASSGLRLAEFVRTGVFRPARDRAMYLPVVAVWPPTAANERLLGLDLLSEPARRITLARSERTRATAFTRLVPLVAGGQGLLAFKPLYPPARRDARPVAYVSASFSTSLIAQTLEQLPSAHRVRVTTERATVYETADPPEGGATRTATFGGRRWLVQANAEGASHVAALAVALGGLALAWLLGAFTSSRVSFERRILRAHASEHEARERAELLERHAAHLVGAMSARDVAATTVSDLVEAGIEVVAVHALRGDVIELLASSDDTGDRAEGAQPYRLDAHTAGAQAMRAGEVVEIASGEEYDARFPDAAERRRAQGIESAIAVPLRRADGTVIGALVVASTQSQWPRRGLRLVVTGIAEQCAVALERAQLQSLERDARRRTTTLQQLAGRLSASVRPADVAEATFPALREALHPDLCVVGTVTGDEVAVLWSSRQLGGDTHHWRYGPAAPGTLLAQALSGQEVERHGGTLVRELAGEEAVELLGLHELGSILLVPLAEAGGCLGVGFVATRVLDTAERDLLTAISQALAQALERSALFEAERTARLRAELMERNAARLAAASTLTEVADATVADFEAFGAQVVYVWRLEGVRSLEALASTPVPRETRSRFESYPLDRPGLVADALRQERLEFVETAEEFDARYPEIAAERERLGIESMVAVPLRSATGDVVGALFAASSRRRWLDAARRQLVLGLAEQTGVALERATLFETEREARRLAELLEENAAHLAAAASVFEVASSTVADLERAGIGLSTVHVVRDRTVELLSAAGIEPDVLEPLRVVARDSPTMVADAVRSGVAIEVPSRRELDERYPGSVELHRALGAVSALAVPLRAADRAVVGVLRVSSQEEGSLTPSRRQVIFGIAEQCGVALERALLYAEAERTGATATFLAALAEGVERATSVDARARRLCEQLTEERATFAAVHLLEAGDASPQLVSWSGSWPAETVDEKSWLRHVELAIRKTRLLSPGRSSEGISDSPSLLVVPLRVRGHTIGALTIRAAPDARWEPLISTELAREIASRAAVALDNALLYERERDVSHSLQLGLLGGGLPSFDGVVVTAAYRPGTATLEVGGDWYDAFRLPSGTIALVVGDVVGHGLEAAVAMGQLRGAVSALAQSASPARLLERLDAFVENVPSAATATLAFVQLDAATGRVRYACAGHPPPLVVSPDGSTRFLWDGRSAPLGSMLGEPRSDAVDRLADGETLVLYTDGLVERRSESLDAGFERLAAAAVLQARTSPALADDIGTALIEGQTQDDDVCVLTVHRVPAAHLFSHSFKAAPVELARLRERLRAWLDEAGVDEDATRGTVLAVSEAAANAVEHGYDYDPTGVVTVMARLDGSGVLQITVRDEGEWRDRDGDGDSRGERGRGLPIIEAIVDDVSIERGGDATVVRMSRVARAAARA